MFQRRRKERRLTPRTLNFAEISINVDQSPPVPFHLAYVQRCLFSYSRIKST